MIIPPSLWTSNTIHLPNSVITDYRNQLQAMQRYGQACGESPKAEIGGFSEEATFDHFVHRFAASAVRTEYFLLDPRREFGEISSDLLNSFTDGVISILDVPCGAGAGLLGFLGLVHELRTNGFAKKLPLNIYVTAGDYSPHARALYQQMLVLASPWLREQGIRLVWECHDWDAKQEPSTALIVDKWFAQSPNSEEWLVLVAAISGELGGETEKPKIAENSRFFQHICSRMHSRFGDIYWIEPRTNQSKWLIARILEMIGSSLTTAFRRRHHSEGIVFNWKHPFKLATFNGGIRVLEHRRTNNA